MAKSVKKHRWIFPVALVLYAIVFLVAAGYGLRWFWNYIDAYEQSRPHIALDAYMENLTAEYVTDRCGELIATIDHNVQTEEQCRRVILDALQGNFTCAKKTSESDEDHHVYVIRCGAKVVGTMEMDRLGESVEGFIPWQVTKDSFDLSYLLAPSLSITVPEEFTVSALGNPLSGEYITEQGIRYDLVEEFYDDHTLPCMVTYTAGPFLGEGTLTVTDPAGNLVSITEDTDMNTFLNNCTADEIAALDTIIRDYLQCYMDFTSCTGNDTTGNYNRLIKHMVPGGDLAKRMRNAIDGLYWVSDRGAKLASITTGHYINIGEGRYFCDVTYVVDTKTFSGNVQTTASVKLIFLQTENGLKAESMLSD